MPIPKSRSCGSDLSSSDSDTANVEAAEEEEDVHDSEDEDEEDSELPCVVWTGYGKKTPVIVFKADAVVNKNPDIKAIGEKYHLAYKIVKTESKLVRSILGSHGFHEVHPNSNDFNVQWTGSHLKPYVLRGLQEFQKVNHFPRSYEITRKDRLYKNIQRMQQTKGFRHFDFVPHSYIVPGEFQEFCSAFLKDKGPWIVKPIASSRGRGIFLVNHPEQVPLDETMIVSRYLHNPLTIDGFKFDIRLYVAVTSYDPITIYMYEEGLTRFATVRYDKSNRTIKNQCMHLTNYSVNKKSNDYVKNDDPDVEDFGNKWSLGAMLRYLRSQGKDTTAIMMRVEDVVIKTLISAELPIATACKMFMPFRGNCFELYGFDILIDEQLRPWVLEVNLSPSLACDAPLDLKIKSNMMSDLFSLTGLICHDPMLRKMQQVKGRDGLKPRKARPQSAASVTSFGKGSGSGPAGNLTGEEIRIVRRAKEENQRRGGWVRIFPSPDSWELYGSYLQYSTTHNVMLYQQLFPDRARNISLKPTTAGYTSGLARTRNVHLHSAPYPQLHVSTQPGPNGKPDEALAHAIQRTLQYERKLTCLGQKKKKGKLKHPAVPGTGAPVINGKFKGVLVQGVPEYTTKSKKEDKRQEKKPPAVEEKKSREVPEMEKPQADKAPERCKSPPPTAKVNEKIQEDVKEIPEKVKENMVPAAPVQTHKPHVPEYNVIRMLEKGKTMSKVQARFAFATYLLRVQNRLMTESGEKDLEDVDSANEQMDLVLRFLKRAAGNLQQPFKVVVPSRKLALNDRRRILSKQLGDFVHIYSKETEQLRQRHVLEKKMLRRPPSFTQNDGLDEERFTKFVNMASESELEEVLTTYTKLNKSASIFLGSNSKSTLEGRPPSITATNSQSDTCLARRKEGSDNNCKIKRKPKSELGPSTMTEPIAPSLPHRPASSSYATAVSIYSSKLSGASNGSTRTRPVSAHIHRNQATSYHKTRPMSANIRPATSIKVLPPSSQREGPDGAESNPRHVDDEGINAALHRLALRQQQRQYAAARTSIILPPDQAQKSFPQPLSNSPSVEKLNQFQDNVICSVDDDRGSVRSRNTSENTWKSASDTFNNFVSDIYPGGDLEHVYNQVTGVKPMNGVNYNPTPGSTQFQIIQSQMSQRNGTSDPDQQEMVDQSRLLLEQSKRKHQAMIAQAHAAQQKGSLGSLGLHESATSHNDILPPRPPAKPPVEKKPMSQHRLARTTISEDASDGQFYSSLRYDSSVGSAKPTFTSGYNNGL